MSRTPPFGAATLMHVALVAADIDASLAFYRDALGFTDTYEWDEVTSAAGVTTHRGRVVYLHLGGETYLEFFAGDGAAGPPGPVHHLALVVSDVDCAYESCRAAGATAYGSGDWDGAPTDVVLNGVPPMPARVAFLTAPGGEVIELYERAGAGRERVA
jgi:catechol 2,3-dioxygenase-like lactoylglutathione lyase family enzyme